VETVDSKMKNLETNVLPASLHILYRTSGFLIKQTHFYNWQVFEILLEKLS